MLTCWKHRIHHGLEAHQVEGCIQFEGSDVDIVEQLQGAVEAAGMPGVPQLVARTFVVPPQ